MARRVGPDGAAGAGPPRGIQIIGEPLIRQIAGTPPDASRPDAMGLAALMAACDRVIAIDSGPGLLCQAMANAAAPHPRCLVIWIAHHPVHYACPAAGVEHLVPAGHRRLLHRPIEYGLAYFEANYAHRTYEGGAEGQGETGQGGWSTWPPPGCAKTPPGGPT